MTSGAFSSSVFTATTVPLTGEIRSLAAFTDSTAPNSLPAVSSSPSAGMST